jgi:hypothetical protein
MMLILIAAKGISAGSFMIRFKWQHQQFLNLAKSSLELKMRIHNYTTESIGLSPASGSIAVNKKIKYA